MTTAVTVVEPTGNIAYTGTALSATLSGSASSNDLLIYGGDRAGLLIGGSGADTVMAGSIGTTMSGGAGSDAFVFVNHGWGTHDVITDFSNNDTLVINGFSDQQSAADLQKNAIVSAAGVTLTLSDGTTVTLANLSSTALLSGRIAYSGGSADTIPAGAPSLISEGGSTVIGGMGNSGGYALITAGATTISAGMGTAATIQGSANGDATISNSDLSLFSLMTQGGDTVVASGNETIRGNSGDLGGITVESAGEFTLFTHAGDTVAGIGGAATVVASGGLGYLTFSGAVGATVRGGDNTHVITGGSGGDYLMGNASVTTIFGGTGNDYLVGGGGSVTIPAGDYLNGGDGDDYLDGGAGNDYLDGGIGTDVAVYSGLRADYQVAKLADGSIQLAVQNAGMPGGTDTVVNVEMFQFADGLFSAASLLKGTGVTIKGTSGDDTFNATMTVAGQPFPTSEGDMIDGGAGDDNIDSLGGDDTIHGGLGNDMLNGGVGSDTALYSGMASNYMVTVEGDGSVMVADNSPVSSDGMDMLQSIEMIEFSDATVMVDGNVLTRHNDDGSGLVSTFNITGQAFTSSVSAYDKHNMLMSTRFNGVTGQPYFAFEYDYGAGMFMGAKYFYGSVAGQYEQDIDPSGHLTKLIFTGVSGQAYSKYEYDYSGGKLSGSKYFFTGVSGQPYTDYEMDLDVNGRLTKFAFTGVTGQAYSSFQYNYAGGVLTGSKYFFTGVTGQPFTAYEQDLDSSGRLTRFVFTGVIGQAYSSYAYNYQGGIFRGSDYFFTDVTGQAYTGYEQALDTHGRLARFMFTGVTGQAYSKYEYDYVGGFLTGSKYFYTNVMGQAYTGYEQDIDTSGQLTRLAFTGLSGQPYSSFEYEYQSGVFTGSKYFTTNIAGQPYTGYEQDLDTQGHLTKLAFSGVTGQPYTAYAYDYSNGALTGSQYFYTNIPNQAFSSYETDLDAGGAVALQILNNNDGSHRILGFQDNLTIHSVFNDVTTGGGSNETFAYTAHFGQSTVTDFASHMTGAGHDSFQMPVADFADFDSMLAGTKTVGGNAVIMAANGDQLTLLGVTKTTLVTLGADFSFA